MIMIFTRSEVRKLGRDRTRLLLFSHRRRDIAVMKTEMLIRLVEV